MDSCNTCAISHNATVLMNNTLDHQYAIGPRGGAPPQWPLDPPLNSVPLNSEVDPEQLNIFKNFFRLTIDRNAMDNFMLLFQKTRADPGLALRRHRHFKFN